MNIDLNKVQTMLEWVKTKLYLDTIASKAKTRVVKRGQVYRCNFGYGVGSEMQKDRPCVILQNDIGNIKSPNTIVAPITHDMSKLACMASIDSQVDESGEIILDGQVNTANTMCISKARLGSYVTELTKNDMKLVDEAMAKTLGIMGYYSDAKRKLDNKLKYIDKIKKDRNEAQDFIKELQKELKVSSSAEIMEKVKALSSDIDR
ncbi:MAG: type II toxin-antitoxin system PemK/MazF family toxin [Clostridium sp.]|uniref:type II toxin-antitoxin system PemK/MazF family toxin n=1 Tax=Clostridium sp. TaxID=1506 RepID=UPI003F3D680C